MNQREFFNKVLEVLDRLRIPYMISGSIGAMLYGEPRLTNDIDIIVEFQEEKVEELLSYFNEDAYHCPSSEFVRSAIKNKSQFNIIHVESGSKADLIIRKETAFARKEFSRKRPIAFTADFDAVTASPEDIIISKMSFYRAGKLEKHISDIVSMLKISDSEIDRSYIENWVKPLGLQDIWESVLSKIG